MSSTLCNRCETIIFFAQLNGRWVAFDDSTLSTYHRCNGVKTSNTIVEKVLLLEKFVRQLEKKIYLQQEKIDELSKGRI